MKVSLIHFTGKGSKDESFAAADLLIFTKSTRLTLTPGLFKDIENWLQRWLMNMDQCGDIVFSEAHTCEVALSVKRWKRIKF